MEFPYKHRYIPESHVDFAFQKLKELPACNWIHDPIKVTEKGYSPKKYPAKFRGRYWLDDTSKLLDYDLNVIVDWFVEEARVKCKRKGHMSPLEYWNENRDVILENCRDVTSIEEQREAIYRLRVPECPHSKTTFMIWLYKLILGNPKRAKIFDACAGFGDRFLACMVMNYDYLGIEPNSDLVEPFETMRLKFSTGNQRILHDYMPDAKFKERNFDLAHISPPSWDSEIYQEDSEMQSINMFKTREEWIVGFMYATLDRMISILRKGGWIVVESIIYFDILPYLIEKGCVYKGAVFCSTSGLRKKPMWILQKM